MKRRGFLTAGAATALAGREGVAAHLARSHVVSTNLETVIQGRTRGHRHANC